jgi:hypothetical protein
MRVEKIILVAIVLFLQSCGGNEKEIKRYDDGKLRLEIPLKDGKRHGLGKEYYPSGKIKTEVEFKNGYENGKCVEYYESGQVSSITFFKDATEIGTTILYFESGEIAEKTFYDSVGRALDFITFRKDGSRSDHHAPIIYRYGGSDEIKVGEKDTLFVKVGNLDQKKVSDGTLVISSALKNGTIPVDTLRSIRSTNQTGFLYPFVVSAESEFIYGNLGLITPDSILNIPFEYKLNIKP